MHVAFPRGHFSKYTALHRIEVVQPSFYPPRHGCILICWMVVSHWTRIISALVLAVGLGFASTDTSDIDAAHVPLGAVVSFLFMTSFVQPLAETLASTSSFLHCHLQS